MLVAPGSLQFDEVADRFNRAAEAQTKLCVALARLGEYAEASKFYEPALRLNPKLTPILLNPGMLPDRARSHA